MAMILGLVILQLSLIAIVISGARDVDTAMQRLDSVRAFYAAEGGINMSVREVMQSLDEDGDGKIGGISNDGNANNDPLIGLARVTVTSAASGSNTDLTASSRIGLARRKAVASVQGTIGALPQTVMSAWSRPGSSTPRYSTWNGSSWSSSSNMPVMAGEAKWVRMKLCPTRNETTFIQEDLSKHVNVCFYTGSSWGSVSLLSSDTGGMNDRPEDIAYEQVSGDALCMYWLGSASKFGYRTYNGTTFTSEVQVSNPFGTECDFLTLCPRYGSNDIVALAADGNAGGPLVSMIWNGSSFGTWTQLVAALETNNEECYAMAYEAQTQKGVVVYTESGVQTPRYRTLTGSTWSSQSSLPTIGGVGKWLRMAADPTSNAIIFAALDDQNDLNVNVWSGSGSWGTNTELEASCPGYDGRYFDVIFERGTGHALIVYGESGVNTPRYRTWNGSSWSAEQTMANLGSTVKIVQLARGFNNGEVFVAISTADTKLHMLRWTGSSMSTDTVVESGLGGWSQYSSFAVPEPTIAPHPRVLNWTETQPQ